MSIYWSLMARSKTDTFRKAVPEDLRQHFGKREIKVSLRKLSAEERPVRELELHRHWEEQFFAARQGHEPVKFAPIAAARGQSAALSNTPLISEVYASWSKTKLHATASTRSEWERAVRYFTELHSDLPIGIITKAQLVEYRDALLKLPRKPNKAWQRMTLTKKLASIEAGEMTGKELISPKSVNKYLTALSALFEKAGKEGILSSNPAQGLKFDAKHSRDDRLAFDEADLQAIFTATLFRENRQEDECYWAMLLGLYTGARLEEIGQLHLKDFRQQGEIWFLDINTHDADKSLKTTSSARRIPLHKDLQTLGLVQYVQAQLQAGEVRMFPRLQKDKRNKYTTALSKRLNRLIDGAGVEDSRKTFHSLRHTFRDYAALHDMPEDRIEAVMGHANGKTSRAYGSGANLAKLDESLQQIRFPIPQSASGTLGQSKVKVQLASLPKQLEDYYSTLPQLRLIEVAAELAPALRIPENVAMKMVQYRISQIRSEQEEPSVLCQPTGSISKEELIEVLRHLGYWAQK